MTLVLSHNSSIDMEFEMWEFDVITTTPNSIDVNEYRKPSIEYKYTISPSSSYPLHAQNEMVRAMLNPDCGDILRATIIVRQGTREDWIRAFNEELEDNWKISVMTDVS